MDPHEPCPPDSPAAPPVGGAPAQTAFAPESTSAWAYRHARRVVVAVVGSTVILLGAIMILTPGPGWAIIFGGLGLLALEFEWARRWLRNVRRGGKFVWRRMPWRRWRIRSRRARRLRNRAP